MNAMPDLTQFFVLGGTLRRDAPSYVARPADDELLKQTVAGEYCNVLAARQMGKSSLMVRTADRLRARGIHPAIIDLTAIGTDVTADEWYFGLITRLSRQLRLQNDEQAWWQARPETSPVQRFSDFVRDVVLRDISEPIVVFIDEIDSTLRLKFTDDFFAAIRAMFNARADESPYQRISFVLLGVARPADLIKDRTRTPYNIGVNIDLTDFTLVEAQNIFGPVLEAAHPGQGTEVLRWALDWTGGQPYLTQKLCADVAARTNGQLAQTDIDQIVERLFLSDEARKESNLQAIRDRVLSNSRKTPVLKLYQKILVGKTVKAEERSVDQNELKLTGLVRVAYPGILATRNRVYARVFDQTWVKANLPADRSRRIAAVAIVVAVLAVLAAAFVIANQQDVSAQLLIDQFNRTSSSEVRISSLAGLIKLGEVDEARTLFDSLGEQGQIDLFSPENLPNPRNVDNELVVVVDQLYPMVANTNLGNTLLQKMENALRSFQQFDGSAALLVAEIKTWLEGRQQAAQGDFKNARVQYTDVYSSSVDRNTNTNKSQHVNAGVLIDRGIAEAELRDMENALNDWDAATQLDDKLAPLIVTAAQRYPDLMNTWSQRPKLYQHLNGILPTLTVTPPPTNTPALTSTPTDTPTPTPTITPTPVIMGINKSGNFNVYDSPIAKVPFVVATGVTEFPVCAQSQSFERYLTGLNSGKGEVGAMHDCSDAWLWVDWLDIDFMDGTPPEWFPPTATASPSPQITTPNPTATPSSASTLQPIVVSTPIDLLAIAPRAAWSNGSGQSGLWLDQYPTGVDPLSARGYAAYALVASHPLEVVTSVENGQVLATHPPDGFLRGEFPLTLPPQGANLNASMAYLLGAKDGQFDGVSVEFYWCNTQSATPLCTILNQPNSVPYKVIYNGQVKKFAADLTPFAGQTGVLRLVVNSQANSGNDWLTWTQLIVTPN